jgi:glucose dehydrogenase
MESELAKIGVCLMRPAGSAPYLLAMLAFVAAAWLMRSRSQASSRD